MLQALSCEQLGWPEASGLPLHLFQNQKVDSATQGGFFHDRTRLGSLRLVKPGRESRSGLRYAEVSQREQKFLDVTSLTVEEFGQLVPAFHEGQQTDLVYPILLDLITR